MNTKAFPTWSDSSPDAETESPSPPRRFFGVVARPQTYRNLAYLLLGLPLGTLWFSVLVTLASVSVSMLVVALLGIPLLIGTWYAVRAFANVERAVTSALLEQHVDQAPMAAGVSGNLWVRLRDMSRDRARWRELGYLMLRFPAGIATFTLAVTALTVPVITATRRSTPASSTSRSATGSGAANCRTSPAATRCRGHCCPAGRGTVLRRLPRPRTPLARACGRWTAASLDGDQLSARSVRVQSGGRKPYESRIFWPCSPRTKSMKACAPSGLGASLVIAIGYSATHVDVSRDLDPLGLITRRRHVGLVHDPGISLTSSHLRHHRPHVLLQRVRRHRHPRRIEDLLGILAARHLRRTHHRDQIVVRQISDPRDPLSDCPARR